MKRRKITHSSPVVSDRRRFFGGGLSVYGS
jgi:hypothetical protein